MNLPELIMVIVTVGILAATVFFPVVNGIDLWDQVQFRENIVSEARVGLRRMARHLTAIKPCSIYVSTGGRLLYNGTADSDPECGGTHYVGPIFEYRPNTQRVVYYTGDTCAALNPSAATLDSMTPFLDKVQSFTFEYFDMWGNPIASSLVGKLNAAIWRIRITATLDDGNNSLTIQEEVYPTQFLRENKRTAATYDADDPDCP